MEDGWQDEQRKVIKLKLEIDSKSHPAWTGGKASINDSEGQVARFEKRFKGLKLNK